MVPVRVAWANAVPGSRRRTRIARHFVRLRIDLIPLIWRAYRQSDLHAGWAKDTVLLPECQGVTGSFCPDARQNPKTCMQAQVACSHRDIDKGSARNAAERLAIGECQVEHPPRQQRVLPGQRFSPSALALGDGLENRAVMLLGNREGLVGTRKDGGWEDHRARRRKRQRRRQLERAPEHDALSEVEDGGVKRF